MTFLPTLPVVTGTGEGNICINCSFSDHKITGCVGVIHSAELKNLTLIIHPVNRTDYSSNLSHNYSCIQVQEQGDHVYSVAVFGQLKDRLEEAPAVVSLLHLSVRSATSTTSHSTGLSINELLSCNLNVSHRVSNISR